MTTSIVAKLEEIRPLSLLGAEKITFPPKPDGQTDIRTDGRTDISIYRVASLLKRLDLLGECLYPPQDE